MRHNIPAIAIATLLFAGCDKAGSTSPSPAPATPQAAAPAPPAEVPRMTPVYKLEVVTSQSTPKTYKVKWTAKVNTGGWTMKTEQASIEEDTGRQSARIYISIEQPGAGEMVTQAITTLEGEFDAGQKVVDQAELSAKQTIRGENSPFKPLYSIVKRVGFKY